MPAAARTASAVIERGHQAYLYPLINLEPIDTAIPTENFNSLIITSEAVFEVGAPLFDFQDMPLFTVGERTQRRARESGFTNLHDGELTSRELLMAILKKYPQKNSKPKRWLYITGKDRKKDLEEGLAQAGHVITPWEVYRAVAAVHLPSSLVGLFKKGRIDTVLHYSLRSARIFRQLMARDSLQDLEPALRHILISETLKDAFPSCDSCAFDLHIASSPTEEAMLTLLDQLST
jgi:uroporphyrinogen-III synthase